MAFLFEAMLAIMPCCTQHGTGNHRDITLIVYIGHISKSDKQLIIDLTFVQMLQDSMS